MAHRGHATDGETRLRPHGVSVGNLDLLGLKDLGQLLGINPPVTGHQNESWLAVGQEHQRLDDAAQICADGLSRQLGCAGALVQLDHADIEAVVFEVLPHSIHGF